MEGLPLEICHKIFCLMDYQSLAAAHQGPSILSHFSWSEDFSYKEFIIYLIWIWIIVS